MPCSMVLLFQPLCNSLEYNLKGSVEATRIVKLLKLRKE
ncbi:hypothetical protein AALP_AA5G164900 [Arabis alpina]|uniref:Uncharacterized protein n=1 Tax=Arabis alpina TaxID=50452 RepID=A0A087GXI1_ARAAL|nr:hypothetical protein AALP_AA5G164900 [Arabis alpina]